MDLALSVKKKACYAIRCIMKSTKIGDYIESGYTGHDVFMSSQSYGQALDSLVFACVDIFALHDDKVIIAKRSRHPQADWWIFGGRMKTGEEIAQSAQRLMRIETGLDINPSRFEYLTTFVAAWRKRSHAPEQHGSHNVSITVTVELSKSEFQMMELNDEYIDSKLVDLDELLDHTAYHAALSQCVEAYRQSKLLS